MNLSIKSWLELAATDLLAAQRLQDDERLTSISCVSIPSNVLKRASKLCWNPET